MSNRVQRIDMRRSVEFAAAAMGLRLDANEAAAFARSLEYIFTETYDVEYPGNKARQIFAVDSRVPAWAESYTYRAWDEKGEASFVNNFGRDFPTVEAIAFETTQKVKSMGASYSYSIQEMRAAAGTGLPLDTKKAQAARNVMERLFEKTAWKGDSSTGLYGILTAPGVQGSGTTVKAMDGSTYTPPAAGTISQAWWQKVAATGKIQQASGFTPAGAVADVAGLVAQIAYQTNGLHQADTLVVDVGTYAFLNTTPAHPTYNSDSLMKFMMDSLPTLRRVEWSPYLNDAGANSRARMIVMDSSKEVVSLIVPQEFEQFAPQPVNMAFHVPCHMRNGGIEVRRPLAIATADGHQGANA